jgi:hypothetical protein
LTFEVHAELIVQNCTAEASGPGKVEDAARPRSETTMTWAWIANHLQMGTAGYVPTLFTWGEQRCDENGCISSCKFSG